MLRAPTTGGRLCVGFRPSLSLSQIGLGSNSRMETLEKFRLCRNIWRMQLVVLIRGQCVIRLYKAQLRKNNPGQQSRKKFKFSENVLILNLARETGGVIFVTSRSLRSPNHETCDMHAAARSSYRVSHRGCTCCLSC